MTKAVKYIMIGCLIILALFHLYYKDSNMWNCLYFGVEYFAISILLIYIGVLINKILKKKETSIQKGDPLFFSILSGYFIFKLWYNINFYYPMFNLDVKDVQKWGFIATIVIICVLFGLQILMVVTNVKKR